MAAKSNLSTMVVVLGTVTLLSSVSLGFVYQWTKEPIAKARLEKQLKAIEAVVPAYDNNPVADQFRLSVPQGDSLTCFPATRAGALVGMAIKTNSSKCYSGDIWLMVGFEADGTIRNIVVIQHNETPGLGSKMTTPAFYSQFIGKDPASFKLSVNKDGGQVDGITGATISSRAYCQAVQRAYEAFKNTDYGK